MVKIRITAAGVGVNVQGHGREEGAIVEAEKWEADYFLRRGFAELVRDEPPAEQEPEPEPEPEVATAEPAGETTMRPAAPRRRGG